MLIRLVLLWYDLRSNYRWLGSDSKFIFYNLTRSRTDEIDAYDNIAQIHSLGRELNKSQYYHLKAMDGGYEMEESPIRKVYVNKHEENKQ